MSKKATLQSLPIEYLVRGTYQPRKQFDSDELKELAESIKTTQGVLQPVLVRPLKNNQYEIIAGERRWRAAQLAGLTEISCLIRPYTDEQALQASLIENINRSNLNPIEEAEGYQRLIDEFHYLHDEIAATLGKSRAAITNALRLLKLEPSVKSLIISKQLSEGHGKMLAGLPPKTQITLAERCVDKKWSVRRLENEIKKLTDIPSGEPYSDANVQQLEKALSDHLGNPVEIHYKTHGGGHLHLHFNNIDELEGHFARLGFTEKM